MTRDDLKSVVLKAIIAKGGKARLIDVAKYIWEHHEHDLRGSGDRFYRWQYEMRWAANSLRAEGRLAPAESTDKGIWAIK
jgi:hypothetical protein